MGRGGQLWIGGLTCTPKSPIPGGQHPAHSSTRVGGRTLGSTLPCAEPCSTWNSFERATPPSLSLRLGPPAVSGERTPLPNASREPGSREGTRWDAHPARPSAAGAGGVAALAVGQPARLQLRPTPQPGGARWRPPRGPHLAGCGDLERAQPPTGGTPCSPNPAGGNGGHSPTRGGESYTRGGHGLGKGEKPTELGEGGT